AVSTRLIVQVAVVDLAVRVGGDRHGGQAEQVGSLGDAVMRRRRDVEHGVRQLRAGEPEAVDVGLGTTGSEIAGPAGCRAEQLRVPGQDVAFDVHDVGRIDAVRLRTPTVVDHVL